MKGINKTVVERFQQAYKATTEKEVLLCMHTRADSDIIVLTAKGDNIEVIDMIARVMEENKDLRSVILNAVEYHISKQEESK